MQPPTPTSTFKYFVQTVNYVSGTLSIFTDSQFQVLLHPCEVLWLSRGKAESRVFDLCSETSKMSARLAALGWVKVSSHFGLFDQYVLVT